MVVKIYSTAGSPPCRAVLLTVKALGISVSVKEIDLMGGQTKTPEYLKMNPQGTVPTMQDNDLIIPESRAIMQYLCDAYGKNDKLYPKNNKIRALVNARLLFDATSLYQRVGVAYLAPVFRRADKHDDDIPKLDSVLATFDTLIGPSNLYLAGDSLTIADITCVVSVSTAEGCGHDLSKYKNIQRWFANAKKVISGYNDINQKQVDLIGGLYKSAYPNKPKVVE